MGDLYREENDREDEDEEDEGDGEGGSRRMLGFMFGNVDDAGDLDEEYLDQDAKEHLSALADQLGPSLVDIELSAKKKGSAAVGTAAEEQEDYDKKADDAVDYEDIQEEYEGPEVQFGPQDMQFYAQAALAGPPKLPEEDNYDEDEDFDTEEQPAGVVHDTPCLLVQEVPVTLPAAEEEAGGGVAELDDSDEEVEGKEDDLEQPRPCKETATISKADQEVAKIELPVLCEEDGKTVLRFSELFGVREPYWVVGQRKGRQKRCPIKEKQGRVEEVEEGVEEDEDAVLKMGSHQPLVVDDSVSRECETERDSDGAEESEEGSGIEEEVIETLPVTTRNRRGRSKHKKPQYVSEEPMKEKLDAWAVDIADWKRRIPWSNFDLIHQQEWEANILWDDVDSRQTDGMAGDRQADGTSVLSMELDSDSGGSHASGVEHERTACLAAYNRDGPKKTETRALALDCQWHRPFLIEPLSRPSCSGNQFVDSFREVRHPQMLRLESRSFTKQSECQDGTDGKLGTTDVTSRLGHLTLGTGEENPEFAAGVWLDSVVWEEEAYGEATGLSRPKVIFDLKDRQMVFEIPDTKEGKSLRLHAAAVVLTPQGKEGSAEGGEGQLNASMSLTRFNISNDKYYTNKKTHQQQKSHAKKRAVHGVKVMHSLPAIKLQTLKPKLSNKDLANFHRPKAVWYPHHNEVAAKEQGKLAAKGPMKVILKTLGGKGSKLHVDASETLEVLKAKAAKKLGDLKPSEQTKVLYSGKELEEGLTFSQQLVPPNSVLHLVRTKVHPWPKAQRLPGENKPIRPPGAFKKKSELSVKDGHVALMEYCEERPLLLGNVGMGARLSTYYRKLTPTDATAATLRNERGSWVGVPLPLEPTEDSPFLGDIRAGDTQSSLETNMYRAPVFSHKVAATDFLLVRSAKGKLSLRRIDSVHVVGQQEPHMEVLTPTSKMVQNYIGNRLLVYLYREFRANEKPGLSLPRVRADELLSQFPSLTEGFMRKRLKHCGDLQRIPGGEMCWVMRRNFRIPSEEELRRMVTPENVCTYESMQAGLHHLKRMGVHKLTQPTGLSAAMNQLPDEAITLAAASHVERELQITPWNLSSNFVAATMQGRGSLERLEIVGPGDPSGRGLGFSYLRVATKPPNSGALVEKKAAAARGGGAVTGTDADLRRLSMDAAREVLLKFKVAEEVIEKLTRWHRIAMVRKLSSEQAASGVKVGAAALNKFARGQRMSFLQLQQQTREKCQDIWDKQAQSLSVAEGDDTDSDGEANGDLDSFAGDLENLLEAEEGDEVGGRKGKREGMRGLGARRRLLQAQREEEIEDEEAEAAELRRMLMEDDEAEEEQKKKKSGTASKDKKDPQSKELSTGADGQAQGGKKKRRILKRIIRTRKPDGSYTSKEIIITDPKEVASYLAKKNAVKGGGQKGGADKDGALKKGSGKPPLMGKKTKKGTPIKDLIKAKVPVKGKGGTGSGKFGRDALTLVCGACGQLGHMRTNKKCPLYMEDGDAVAWQDIGAAAEGLLERQGTKITIKKKKMDELHLSKPTSSSAVPKVTVMKKEKLTVPLAKLPSLKIKLGSEPSVGSTPSKMEENPAPLISKKVSDERGDTGSDGGGPFDANDIGDSRAKKVNKVKILKRKKKKKDIDRCSDKEKEERVRKLASERARELQLEREYQAALEEERLREEQELEAKERAREEMVKSEREERERKEQEAKLKMEKDRLRMRMKEKERQRKEREQLEEDAAEAEARALQMEKEREERAREEWQRERLREKKVDKVKLKRARENEKVPEKEKGKGVKRRPGNELGAGAYQVADLSNPSKRQRKRGGEVELSNILGTVVDILKRSDVSYLFQKPVPKKDAPDYLQFVKRPMDLATIREKVRKLRYSSRAEFRRDVQQISDNAHIYNDARNPGIPPLADRLLEICDDELEVRDAELAEAESAVERFDEDYTPKRGLSPQPDRRRSLRSC